MRGMAGKHIVVTAVRIGTCGLVSLRKARAEWPAGELGVLQGAMASGATARGMAGAILAQARAASIVSVVALQTQWGRAQELMSHGDEHSGCPGSVAIMVYTYEWGETSQRLQSAKRKFGNTARRAPAQRSFQAIEQHRVFQKSLGVCGQEDHLQEPLIVKSMLLAGQTAGHL